MRSTVLSTALVCGLMVGGCSSSSSGAPTAPPDQASTTAAAAGKTIPDGTYSAVAVRAAALKKGLPAGTVDAILGPPGKLTFTLKIQGKRWAQFQTTTAGVTELGDKGTVTYQGTDRLTTISTSSGAAGASASMRWTYDGHILSLAYTSPAGPDSRLVMEHAFRKVA